MSSEIDSWFIKSDLVMDDALGLAWGGVLASRALEEESDKNALSAMFHAIEKALHELDECLKEARAEWHALKYEGADV